MPKGAEIVGNTVYDARTGRKVQLELHHAVGLLPTPENSDYKNGCAPETAIRRLRESRGKHTLNLPEVVKLIQTPRTEGHDAVRHRGKADSLHSWAKDRLIPTPTHSDAMKTPGNTRRASLKLAVKQATRDGLPTTPTADDTGARTEPYGQGGTASSAQIGGKLNPEFVEFLMNYPKGWTDLD